MIELMVVIAVVSIVVTFGAPPLVSLVTRSRMSSEMNAFVGEVQLTRSEAIKRGLPVGICASTDQSTCSNLHTWHTGWIVFIDADASSTFNSGETVLRAHPAFASADTFVSNLSNIIIFNRDGYATNITAASLIALKDPSGDPNLTRCVAFSRVGRHTLQKAGAGSCA